jgi:hypothetical protein
VAVSWLPELCSELEPRPPEITHPLLLNGREGLLWLFRAGAPQERVATAANLSEDGASILGPVGARNWAPNGGPTAVGGGFNLSAVRVGSNILMAERDGIRQGNSCSRLRVFDLDGRDVHDAPFQLDCLRREAGRVITAFVDMVPTPQGAFFVWGERSGPLLADPTAPGYWERIRAVLLDANGRRASEIVDVTPPGAVAPGEFVPMASAFESDVAVAWRDLRPDQPGIWVRIFHAEPIAP